ncbi:LysR family transcriptional regulator [Gluconacetobacter takamatsuzukensis]|uniref:LysR family transcriptional regulator n=1 Tax=Gluconacetobacter takamatsuzukensis TaxID=1286190 RepID=A0A7W4KAU3_9PROT|nr:LysR family transcriptional regulator [Gluconacetobacter takamatsuzukensis]MBB2203460.1 LysR family transcriptional regulator [Gluconacetobacter takamatsuzukensis]
MPAFSRFLLYFLAVARHGSIRRASEELRIAASAIDRQLLQGEKALGAPLFERLPTGMRLTAAGEILHAHARRWHRDFADVTRQIDDLKGLRRGQLTLAAPEALTHTFLTGIIARLRQTHPGIVVNLRIHDNAEIAGLLDDGSADLALMLDPEGIRSLHVRSAALFPLGFVSPPGHRLARLASARFSACADEPTIVPASPLAVAGIFARLEADCAVAARMVTTSNNVQLIKSLVAAGTGISLLSSLDVMEEVARGLLCFTPLAHASVHPLALSLVHDRGRHLSAAARLVADTLDHALTDLANMGENPTHFPSSPDR